MTAEDAESRPACSTGDVAGPGDAISVRADDCGRIASPWSFASLIHPVAPAEFCASRWGDRPLHIARGRPDFYADLITLGEVERYFSLPDIFERHSVTTPREGEGLPEPPPASVGELFGRMLDGSLLRIRQMERFMDPGAPVMALLRNMQLVLQHPLGSLSCYVAPPNAVGLGPHHDETEIFTLQISGTKRWRIYHRVESDQPGIHARDRLGEPVHEVLLDPGDLLYMPRGWVHEVTADAPAFSLTIVFEPIRWNALLELLVADLAATAPFTAPMPAGTLLGRGGRDLLRHQLGERVALICYALGTLDADDLVDAIAPRLVGRMMLPPDARLGALFRLDRLTQETVVERLPDTAWHLARRADRAVLTLAGGYTLEMNARAESALRDALAVEGPFRVTEIPDGLAASAKLALARRLVACGLLRVVEPDHAEATAPERSGR